MANKVRGEVTIRLNGQKVVLRPTFDAIARIEGNIDRGIMSVLTLLQREDLRFTDVVEIVHACAVDLNLSKEEVAQAVMDEGLGAFVMPIGKLIVGVVGGASQDENPSPGTGSES